MCDGIPTPACNPRQGLWLHGVKRRWSQDVTINGLTRDDSACFLWSPPISAQFCMEQAQSHHTLTTTLTLCMYFALSLSTLHQAQKVHWSSWYAYLKEHPQLFPEIVLFSQPHDHADPPGTCMQRYYSFLPFASGWSLPYTKLAHYPPFGCIKPAAIPLTLPLSSVEEAEEAAREQLTTWHIPSSNSTIWPRFFCKEEKFHEERLPGTTFWQTVATSHFIDKKASASCTLVDPRLVALFCHQLALSYAVLLGTYRQQIFPEPLPACGEEAHALL